MPIIDPEKKKLAQMAKSRHFKICRNCHQKFRGRDKCPRCGSKSYRDVHQITAKGKGGSK